MKNAKTVSTVNTFARQVSGFARWQIEALLNQTGLDFFLAYLGTEISDKLVTALRERFGNVQRVTGSRNAVLIVNALGGLAGFNVTRKGDTYTRLHGAVEVTGSVAALEAAYGKKAVSFGTEATFNKMSLSLKVGRNSELRGIKKAKAVKAKKTTGKEKEDSENDGEE